MLREYASNMKNDEEWLIRNCEITFRYQKLNTKYHKKVSIIWKSMI
ncbi:hypothetical protein [Mycoplasmopsis anatis]|uniref:Uncharacterized protein n=1 Tax=Mycoplasmopsis anatis 1340 TaxID=1034808 RepID=F9QDQ1_9BACT|nr:hypothetical protein [Mycoplasmopsis anatis]EGS29078.1 hypothetical protein GIG_02623 [Mycoplasmopsis anatis 1340]